jgi:hypothetical protein
VKSDQSCADTFLLLINPGHNYAWYRLNTGHPSTMTLSPQTLYSKASSVMQRFAAHPAAYCSGKSLYAPYSQPFFVEKSAMTFLSLVKRWWWMTLVLTGLGIILFFTWDAQQNVEALEKKLRKPTTANPKK